MIETIVQIEGGRYPFDESVEKGHSIRIEDIQQFTNIGKLMEKKSEMIKKSKLVKSNYIIPLLKIYQEELTLHYIYEHVPHSFAKIIEKRYRSGNQQII